MAKYYDKLITENIHYCEAKGTIIISNLTEHYDLCIVRESDKALLFGDEQGNYDGGISITPNLWYGNKLFGDSYEACIKLRLYKLKSHQIVFYNNIKKVAYPYHKELFDEIENNFKELKHKL